jgi:hypothetical protein
MKYICKKFINHQIKKCLLFRCHHAVVIMQTLNWTNQCPLFMTVRHIFEISEDDHPSNTPTLLVSARDIRLAPSLSFIVISIHYSVYYMT